MIWLWALFIISLTVAGTIVLLCAMDAHAHGVTKSLNEARARGMNTDSVAAALKEKP